MTVQQAVGLPWQRDTYTVAPPAHVEAAAGNGDQEVMGNAHEVVYASRAIPGSRVRCDCVRCTRWCWPPRPGGQRRRACAIERQSDGQARADRSSGRAVASSDFW